MSNIKLIIEERPANIGNFMVGRLLPFREKRMVGPFSFIDHMGPAAMSEVGAPCPDWVQVGWYYNESSNVFLSPEEYEEQQKPKEPSLIKGPEGPLGGSEPPEWVKNPPKSPFERP